MDVLDGLTFSTRDFNQISWRALHEKDGVCLREFAGDEFLHDMRMCFG